MYNRTAHYCTPIRNILKYWSLLDDYDCQTQYCIGLFGTRDTGHTSVHCRMKVECTRQAIADGYRFVLHMYRCRIQVICTCKGFQRETHCD